MASTSKTGTRRVAEWIFALSAMGEIVVGMLVALLPAAVMGFLLGAPLDATGAAAARMMGVAVIGLGLGWWPDRHRLDSVRMREIASGFVVFNLGVGVVFLTYAWTHRYPVPMSGLVAVAHLTVGSAFAILVAVTPVAPAPALPREHAEVPRLNLPG